MLTEVSQVSYALKVGGSIYRTFPSRQLAEAAVLTLPADQQRLTEIVPIQQDSGKELLLG